MFDHLQTTVFTVGEYNVVLGHWTKIWNHPGFKTHLYISLFSQTKLSASKVGPRIKTF